MDKTLQMNKIILNHYKNNKRVWEYKIESNQGILK